uniref:T9SS type A sorting domain-containing protein n=1 Tax=candidate division WOR-3 bacterium TaxID=2052148 RepID=A0A7C3Z265_UNCW3
MEVSMIKLIIFLLLFSPENEDRGIRFSISIQPRDSKDTFWLTPILRKPLSLSSHYSLRDYDTLFNDDGIPWWRFLTVPEKWWAQKFSPGVPCTLKKVLIMTHSFERTEGNLYLWRDSAGLPGEVIFGPIRFESDSIINWQEVDIPDTVIFGNFWVGLSPPYQLELVTDRRYNYRGCVAFSENGITWHRAEWLPWGDFMIRVLCLLTGERHEIGVWQVLAPTLLPFEQNVPISAVVQNLGNTSEDSLPISYFVYDEENNLVASDTELFTLRVREIDTIRFSRFWRTRNRGRNLITVKNLLPDCLPENDSSRRKVFVHRYPTTLQYDDGTLEGCFGLGVDSFGRFAMKFTPPYYPCLIESLKLYLLEDQRAIGLIFDDDGPDGGPGTILWIGSINAYDEGWYTINLSTQGIIIPSGSFYASYQNAPRRACEIMGDMTEPLTELDWTCYDGFWEGNKGLAEYGIRVSVNYPIGLEEEKKIRESFLITPNPVRNQCPILIPGGERKELLIINASGRVCSRRTFSGEKTEEFVWNLPPGVYFLELRNEKMRLRKRILSLR